MNPKQFLQWGGAILVLVGVLGYVGVIGPTPDRSLFGEFWWFDNVENVVHTLLGVVALVAAFLVPMNLHKPLVIAVGVVALIVAVWGGLVSTNLWGATLENPADTVLHLIVGVWALWAGMRGSSM